MQDKLTHQYFNWLPFSPCTYMGCVYAGCMSDNYCVCVCVCKSLSTLIRVNL